MIREYELNTKTEYDLANEIIKIAPKNKYKVEIIHNIYFNGEPAPDRLILEEI